MITLKRKAEIAVLVGGIGVFAGGVAQWHWGPAVAATGALLAVWVIVEARLARRSAMPGE